MGGWGVRVEKGHAQREKRRERERKRPKYLDYIEESLLEKGSPVPGLESSSLEVGYARSGTEGCWENLEATSALIYKIDPRD